MVRTLNPLRERVFSPLEDLYKEVDQLVGQFFQTEDAASYQNSRILAPINLTETETGYEVAVDLPGFKPDEVHVEMNDGQLTISGERKAETKEDGKSYHRIERRYGSFRRIIQLPLPVDEEK